MYKFINPYNFIPMGNKKSKIDTDKELVSGVIEYSVLTKTPLFIPNTSYNEIYNEPGNQEAKEHKSYQFYSYVDYSIEENRNNIKDPEPVIPGSEIRGMFRNNFEIMTNSCMSALDSDMKLSKRTMESYKAGLLRRVQGANGKVQYDLYEAEDVLWRTMGENSQVDDLHWKKDKEHNERKCYIQDNFSEGERVDFRIRRRGNKMKPLAFSVKVCKKGEELENVEGYIIKGEKGPKKHCCHIFKLNGAREIPIQRDVAIYLLEELLEVYANNRLENANEYNKYKKYREQLIQYKNGNGNEYFPVYYSIISENRKQKLFLAPACKTREIYDNSLENLAGDFAPCKSKNNLCEACELFGTVTSQGESKSSKIRFTDLRVEKMEKNASYYFGHPITLPEMSSPKLNNMEFYLEKPSSKNGKGARFWTYDYFIDESGKLHIEQGKLAGRKFYWHQNLDNNYDPKESRRKCNITIKPAKAGLIFYGKVYFEKITKKTLDKLVYLINVGEESCEIEKKEHGYKIGMAKPLGLGSIACNVDEVKIKSYKIEDNMVKREEQIYDEYNLSEVKRRIENVVGKELIENFGKMTGFQSVKLREDEYFSYPKTNQDSKGYEWFAKENHKGVRNNMPISRNEMIFINYMKAMKPRVRDTKLSEEAIKTGIVQPYTTPNIIKFKIGEKAKSIQCSRLGISSEEAQSNYPEGSEIKVYLETTQRNGFEVYKILEE